MSATNWQFIVDWDRNFNFTDPYDDISDDYQSANWSLGMGKAFNTVADESTLELKVRNTDGKYNPENPNSPIAGKMLPHCPVLVKANGVTLWRGWTDTFQPDWQVGGPMTGQSYTTIRCQGAKALMQEADAKLTLFQNVTGDEIIAAVLQAVSFPPASPGGWLIGVIGFSEIGVSTYVGSSADYSDLEVGRTIFVYYGDRRGAIGQKQDAWKVINEVTDAEQGRFFFDREGKAIWWNRHHLLTALDVTATIDSGDMNSMRPYNLVYVYGASMKNSIEVVCHPRGVGSTVTLWTLRESLSVRPGETEVFEAVFTDQYRNQASSTSISLGTVTYSSGAASITLTHRGDRALVSITNSGAVTAVLTALTIQGPELTGNNQVVVTAEDATSIALYGKRSMRMNLTALTSLSQAKSIAQFELARRKDPVGEVQQITFLRQADNVENADLLSWTIGTRLTIRLPENNHEADYFIIGERHKISATSLQQETTYILEPASRLKFWLIGVAGYSEIGATTLVGY